MEEKKTQLMSESEMMATFGGFIIGPILIGEFIIGVVTGLMGE